MLRARRSLIRRLGAGSLVLLVLTIVQPLTASSALLADLSVSPDSGATGARVTVTGSGFLPGLEVRLCWDDEGCSNLGREKAGALGGFSHVVTIPGDAVAGSHAIFACQFGLPECPSAGFEVISTTTTSSSTTTTTTTTTLAPTTTTTPSPSTSTTGPTPTTTTTVASATTTSVGGETTTTNRPPTTRTGDGSPPTNGDPPTTNPTGTEPDQLGGLPTPDQPAVDEETDMSGRLTTFQVGSIDEEEVTSPPEARRYTPPRLASDSATAPDSETGDGTADAVSPVAAVGKPWLPEPWGFWVSWLLVVLGLAVAVLGGGALATRLRSSR